MLNSHELPEKVIHPGKAGSRQTTNAAPQCLRRKPLQIIDPSFVYGWREKGGFFTPTVKFFERPCALSNRRTWSCGTSSIFRVCFFS